MRVACVLALLVSGCETTTTNTGTDMAMVQSMSDMAMASGGTLAVPAMATMTAGIGGSDISAAICQNLRIGGGINYSIIGHTNCTGGENYLLFHRSSTMMYRVQAGTILTASGPGNPVQIQSTSAGTLGSTEVTGLPENTDVTISTAGHTKITFKFAGTMVTVSAFQ